MQQQTAPPARPGSGVRADLLCATAAAVLVAAAFALPFVKGRAWSEHLYAAAAPIFGIWGPHIGWGTGPAIAVAVLVVLFGPGLAHRLPWRPMLVLAWLTSVAWTFSLAMIDGWKTGWAGDRLARQEEYLYTAHRITDVGAMLRGFSGRILDFRPDSWPTHVSGHPAGALLTFVLMDRIGLGGGAAAAWVVVLAGCSAAAAVPVALNALGSPGRARAVVPFLVLAPAAVWIGVSADALFTGVTAWAVALLAVATRRRAGWPVPALASGLLFGYGLFLNYGLTLMVVPAAAVLLARGVRGAVPALVTLVGVALVVAAFAAAGFWWLDGYHLVVQRYYQGIASERPYSYWVWGNLAATVCAVGLAAAGALHRVVRGVVEPLAPNRFGVSSAGSPGGSGQARRPDEGARMRQVESADVRTGIAPAAPGGAGSVPAADREPRAAGVAVADRESAGGSAGISATPRRMAWLRREPVWLERWRVRVDPAALLAAAGLVAILAADLSGLSKAETERIWLPFDMWVLAGTALLPRRGAHYWLATQAVAALLINHLLMTNW
ncbi:hypothetical protein [Nocardia albiluteola]|uniref:hypothetical protein n=1 Tax=Nocardia albiluteola TaxID=2842303 RepID=UPI0027E19037|nr:hypothetical protein [Nocardia albiluteola]